ncbi:MAG: 6-carboxytetrahydropterin synthase [Nitrospirae bacterium]|nr:6-carboxytetrahydropterin synthase [Nitrospirota bacterium]MBI3392132.1 6-carboxytetrahydropterin synthase [Nitrospirota bacterium]
MFELTVRCGFRASHQIPEKNGCLEAPHEHDWKVDVVVASADLDSRGIVIDFEEVQHALREVLEPMEGRLLNEVAPFAAAIPSAEGIARWLADRIAPLLPARASLRRVTVWERPDCGAAFLP